MQIVFIAVGTSGLNQVRKIGERWEQSQWRDRVNWELHYVGSDAFAQKDWEPILQSILGKRLVLLDLMGVDKEFCQALYSHLDDFPGDIVVLNASEQRIRGLTRLGKFSLQRMSRMGENRSAEQTGMRKMMKMIQRMEAVGEALPIGKLRDMRNYFWLGKYWKFADEQNIENLLFLLGREYLGYKDFPAYQPPVTIDEVILYDPVTKRGYRHLDHYLEDVSLFPEKATIGVLFSNNNYPVDTFPILTELAKKLRNKFNLIPIAMARSIDRDLEQVKGFLINDLIKVDVLINLLSFRLGAGPMGGDAEAAVQLLQELNVPVLHPFFLSKRTIEEWKADSRGVKTGEFLISIFLPELDGVIETYPIAAQQSAESGIGELALIEERVDHLLGRVLSWNRLQKKSVRERRAAIIFYDYPPGESNLGSGAFLDSFRSLEAILKRLAAEGYNLTPRTAGELRDIFVGGGMVNTPKWTDRARSKCIRVTAAEYQSLTSDWSRKDEIDNYWGEFPGKIMGEDQEVWLPGIVEGNIFIGLQPARGFYQGKDYTQGSAKDYHDKFMPPHHQYVAFYKWLERGFGADICIHLGTHGTVEFLPGKEAGLSGECYPDYLLGTMPHLYVYYSGNPAESMIAKRRSHGVMVSHLHPPFVQSDLYGEMQALEALLAEYEEAQLMNSARLEDILADIREIAGKLGWPWEGLEELAATLYEMKSALIPGRLHIFGSGFSSVEVVEFLVQLFMVSGDGWPSLYQLLAQDEGWDWVALTEAPHRYQKEYLGLKKRALEWIQRFVMQETELNGGDKQRLELYQAIRQQGIRIKAALLNNRELEGLLKGLAGSYISASIGGDVFRNPELLPTGRNLYQFDPRRVPSPSAMRRGKEIAENTLEQYYQVHGQYPESVAVILWGLETSKTQGETIGQILSYLGVRISRSGTLWRPILEVISLEELGRPRVDVTIQICGFFRDMFPNLIELINDAFELVSQLSDEGEENQIKKHAGKLLTELRQMGLSSEEASEFAYARIFGPESAQYGTGVNQLVKSRNWQSEADLVTNYLTSLQYVYTKNHYGREMPGLLAKNLSRVELVSQIRSSRDYELTDLDHYYEYFGGLARTVAETSGKKAMMLISDTHNGRPRTEDVQRSIQRGSRTRLLNPKWLDGMLQHQFHGGQQLADRLENLLGLAATTGSVDNSIFDDANERFVLDETMRNRIRENNQYSLLEIMERLLEAQQRGYWKPKEEDLEELRRQYLKLEGDLEGLND